MGESSGQTHDRHSVHQSIKGFASPNNYQKQPVNRDSALAKIPGAGLFSDILNFNYIDSPDKKKSNKSDSMGGGTGNKSVEK